MTVNKEKLMQFVLNDISKTRILVVGDVMLDRYYYGEVTRISPEAPVPITHITKITDTMGGAANVAHNLALLGCQTSIAGFVGDDFHCQTLLDKFISRGIDDSHQRIIPDDRTVTVIFIILLITVQIRRNIAAHFRPGINCPLPRKNELIRIRKIKLGHQRFVKHQCRGCVIDRG